MNDKPRNPLFKLAHLSPKIIFIASLGYALISVVTVIILSIIEQSPFLNSRVNLSIFFSLIPLSFGWLFATINVHLLMKAEISGLNKANHLIVSLLQSFSLFIAPAMILFAMTSVSMMGVVLMIIGAVLSLVAVYYEVDHLRHLANLEMKERGSMKKYFVGTCFVGLNVTISYIQMFLSGIGITIDWVFFFNIPLFTIFIWAAVCIIDYFVKSVKTRKILLISLQVLSIITLLIPQLVIFFGYYPHSSTNGMIQWFVILNPIFWVAAGLITWLTIIQFSFLKKKNETLISKKPKAEDDSTSLHLTKDLVSQA